MTTSIEVCADSPTLKRTFATLEGPELRPQITDWKHNDDQVLCVISSDTTTSSAIPSPTKRRSISSSSSPQPSMPVQTSPALPTAFPSFMSVFGGLGTSGHDEMPLDNTETNIISLPAHRSSSFTTSRLSRPQYPVSPTYQHRESESSVCSDSTESSPTTTSSMFDSPSITDPSPSSSPESPNSTVPLSPFKDMMTSPTDPQKTDHLIDAAHQATASSDHQGSDMVTSNSRNIKNLSLNMNFAPPLRSATASEVDTLSTFAAPLSPLKGPLKTGRRKPTNLSIKTPGIEKASFAMPLAGFPPTPGQRPPLQHITSTPALPSLMSPRTAPLGGMKLSLTAFHPNHSRAGSRASVASSSELHKLQDVAEESARLPQKSQETQERGYTGGPIKVYDSGVFLYLEPTKEEAAKFDTVINVAKEIKNPFEDLQEIGNDTIMSVWRTDSDTSTIPEPQTAISEVSFKSAFEWPLTSSTFSPPTPKPQPAKTKVNGPEYIHVPWDHNSELIDDLFPLCNIIDTRVAAGKTVLIHCQLGVSRSASLVLAYGLYKGYQPDFHSMYGAVKQRSQWISPNMSLIYQLMDFRTKVVKGYSSQANLIAPREWFKTPELSEPFRNFEDSATTPVPAKPTMRSTATQTDEVRHDQWDPKPVRILPPVPLFPTNETSTDTVMKGEDSAVVSSADSAQTVFPTSVGSDSPSLESSKPTAPRPLPLRERSGPSIDSFNIPPHKPFSTRTASERPKLLISHPIAKMDLAFQDVPDTPSLFSPRQAEFMATPFGRTLAGDLAIDASGRNPTYSRRGFTDEPFVAADPRSPPQKSTTGEIMRNIDEVL